MKEQKSSAVTMFIGLVLIVVFGVGLTVTKNPTALIQPRKYDAALEMFGSFCASVWLPAGIIGIPLFLFSLIRSLLQERKHKRENE